MKKIVIISLISIILFSTNIYAYNYSINNDNIESIESKNDCWVGWKKYHYGNVDELAKKGQSFDVPGSPIIKKHEDGPTEYYEGQSYKITTNGYGYYSLDFEKHVLALLSYIKKNIATVENYDTNYKPTENSTLVDYTLNEKGNVKLEDALKIAMNGMVSNWYSESYEKDEFKNFWEGTFIDSHRDNLRKIQNDFYWNAYGKSAFIKLNKMMGEDYIERLGENEKIVLKGVVFSIMEARYRNKNVQGKMNLKINAAEGELWPFLVYLENLSDISYDEKLKKYVNSDGTDAIYKFPDFDKLIEGAYQWMIYHDADTIRTTSHRTITKTISEINGKEEEDVEIDWESEFCDLTWDYLPALNGKELEKFYSNCQLVKSIFKKSSENTMGFFGAEELYDITSDKNFSEAIRDMKDAMIKFCGDGTMDSVWTGLTDYNMERTYIMAKNIVETNRVKDEFAYYNIGTNIITYTYGRHGKEYMLMDLQRVKLKEALKDKDDKWIEYDTDGDGIFDKDELGDDEKDNKENNNKEDGNDESSMWVKVDITKFIKKAVEKDLYGNDDKEINSKEGKEIVNTALAQVKYNVYKERQQFILDHPDNECDRKEDKENYLNIDSVTEKRVSSQSEIYIREEMKKDSAKLQVRLWKYKSNPVLKDTDFDGIDDNVDRVQKNNFFTGRMHTTRLSGDDAIEVDMNMDYRYFFMSNKLYFDELSTMSLLYANSIYRKGEGQSMHSGLQLKSGNNFIIEDDKTKKTYKKEEIENMDLNEFNNMQVKEMMEHFGFKDVITYYMGERGDGTDDDPADGADECRGYKETHQGKVAIGYKNLEYHGLKKTVIGVVIRGTAEDDDWDSDFDMGDKELRDALNYSGGIENYKDNYDGILSELEQGILDYEKQYAQELLHFAGGYPDWIWDYHHAGFDIVSNRILEVLEEYITTYDSNFADEICFWVTGHSMGGGVANLVAASLVYGECGGNADNVYCYTFAAPNTFYRTDSHYEKLTEIIPGENVTGKYAEPKGIKYRCIFNIVNDDDFVPKLPMEECEWTKYGRVAIKSLNDIIHNEKGLSLTVYNYKIRHEYAMSSLITSNERFLYSVYNGNSIIVDKVIEEFSNIYVNKINDMRRDTYTYNNDYEYYENASFDSIMRDIAGYNKYSLPYLKREKDGHRIKLVQMPAYFMNVVAGGMHNNNNYGEVRTFPILNRAQIKFTQLAKRYVSAREQLVNSSSKIEMPHYLESYCILTKEINITDFR